MYRRCIDKLCAKSYMIYNREGEREQPISDMQPKLASNRMIKAVRRLTSEIKEKRVRSVKKEVENLKKLVGVVLPYEVNRYTPDIRGWFSGVRVQVDPHDLFDEGWTRYQHAVHLEKQYPCMEAMRFGVQLDLPDLVTKQLNAGYHVNAIIEVTDPLSREKRLTYPVVEASTRFKCLEVLYLRRANIDMRNPKGDTALSTAVSRLKRAQSTPIERRTDSMDLDLRDGPMCIETLLRLQCKRGALSDDKLVSSITQTIAIERWTRIRRLLKPLAKSTSMLRELLVHVRYKPGSVAFRECKAEFEDIAHSRPPTEVIDPAEYLDGL